MEYFKFKQPLKINEVRMINPKLFLILAFVVDWAEQRNLPVVITSMIRTPEQNRMLGSKSSTHCDKRAFDMSSKGWSTDDIDDLIADVSREFEDVGALSASDLKSRPVIYHNIGHGSHFHFQVRKKHGTN
jgi:uncharacterized protein YcbK (DUF882 family)